MTTVIRWDRYPCLAVHSHARTWLTIQANLGLATNTVEAYGRALEEFFVFLACGAGELPPVTYDDARNVLASASTSTAGAEATNAIDAIDADTVSRALVAAYVRDLATRPRRHPSPTGSTSGAAVPVASALSVAPALQLPTAGVGTGVGAGVGLANATMQLRLVALRLYFDYLIEEGIRPDNPVGRGRYTPGKSFGGARDRGLLPRYETLPWIPSDDQWRTVLVAAQAEPIRNRFMLALAYDAALRREELCALQTSDLDPARRLVRIRAETSKSRRERVLPYSDATGQLYAAYLRARAQLTHERGALFRSTSDRNLGAPLTIWTWSKVMHELALRADLPQFATHTLRHLRLTDLARAGWEIHMLATFAGHRSLQSTARYIHLSGRDLAAKLDTSQSSAVQQARTDALARLARLAKVTP